MSYTYLQGQEEVSSEVYCWDTDPCALLKSNPIAEKFCCNDSGTESCHGSQSGTMCEHSTGQPGGDELTLFAEDFLARTSAQPAVVPESEENEVDFGEKWHGYVAKFDPDTSSWKTSQPLLFEDLEPSLETWPKWGTMQDGVAWEVTPLDAPITEPGFGWLPTPRASVATHGICWKRGESGKHKGNIEDYLASLWIKSGGKRVSGLSIHPSFCALMMGWPTEWASIKPLETGKIQEWLRLHGKF